MYCSWDTGDCDLEYISLAFNQKGLLLGLSGVPDYRLTLWSWETEERICTVDTGLTVTISQSKKKNRKCSRSLGNPTRQNVLL